MMNSRTLWIAGALAALVALPAQADAQMRIGARAGANFATLSGDDASDDFDSRTGLYLQGVLAFPVGDFFSFETGLAYSQKGASLDEGTVDSDLELTYLEIPLLLKANFTAEGFQPHLLVGPSVAFNIGCTFSAEGEGFDEEIDCDDDPEIDIKGTDVGLIVGAGVDIPFGTMAFTIDGFYNLGLIDLDDSPEENDINNEVWTIAAGISVPFGGM